jgi:hypothetical protein
MRSNLLATRELGIGLVLLTAAVGVRFGLAPRARELPRNYAGEAVFTADCRFRETPAATWSEFSTMVRRVEQGLISSEGVLILQGSMFWLMDTGELTYASGGLYAVDEKTRANDARYGDAVRRGQYLFPCNVARGTYELWDPFYVGPRTATFERVEEVDGLPVYVFQVVASNLDDTKGYDFLPGVPGRYRVRSDGIGRVWVEPKSGIAVEYTDEGSSRFVDAATGATGADMYYWKARYTAETRQKSLAAARSARARMIVLEWYTPLGALAGAPPGS